MKIPATLRLLCLGALILLPPPRSPMVNCLPAAPVFVAGHFGDHVEVGSDIYACMAVVRWP